MNLTGQQIKNSYPNLVTVDGNNLSNGTGSAITNINITSSCSGASITSSYLSGSGVSIVTGSLRLYNQTNGRWYVLSISGSIGSETISWDIT